MNRRSRPTLPEWRALERHAAEMKRRTLRELFAADPGRGRRFALRAEGLYLDYSKNPLNSETLGLLLALADACGLEKEKARLFAGEAVNETEARPALHWALRDTSGRTLAVDGRDVMPALREVRERMAAAAGRIRSGNWLGTGGRPLDHVVHVGIGGSDLGPRMACAALRFYSAPGLSLHFVANLDPSHLAETLRPLSPERTLFILASKTFTTQETLANADAARDWLLGHFRDRACLERHVVAVTANPQAARSWGVAADNIFEFWDWVGGRYSLPSAVGLPLMMAIGPERFQEMLSGYEALDRHFREAPAMENLPLLLALLGVWHASFLGAATHAVLPYSHSLRLLPDYLQQLEMESNGKSADREGRPGAYATAPVLWGGPGTDGQHAYFQLLHQGTQAVPCDLIGFRRSLDPFRDHHEQLLANLLAQAQALAFGRCRGELEAEGVAGPSLPFRAFPGNRPSTVLLADELTPATLGKLVALYEHKVFAQSVIWNIFPFDQWGVELGKKIAGRLLPLVKGEAPADGEDSSTSAMIDFIVSRR